MKKLLIIFSLIITFLGTGFAQLHKDDVQLAQAIWGVEKRSIVTDFMKFTKLILF